MMRALALLSGLILAAPAFAATGPQSYTTVPPGTVMGNPQPWADNPIPHAQSFATVGHIAILKGAGMQVTTDQPLTMLSPPAKYQVTAIYATNCTVSPSGDLGGIYTAASKGGTAVVAAGQAYTALASVTAIQELTINITASLTASQLYFSLSTGTTGGPCDLYVDGIGLQ